MRDVETSSERTPVADDLGDHPGGYLEENVPRTPVADDLGDHPGGHLEENVPLQTPTA